MPASHSPLNWCSASLHRSRKQLVVGDLWESRPLRRSRVLGGVPVFLQLLRRTDCAQGRVVQRLDGRRAVHAGRPLAHSHLSEPLWVHWRPTLRLRPGAEGAGPEQLGTLLLQLFYTIIRAAKQGVCLSHCHRLFLFFSVPWIWPSLSPARHLAHALSRCGSSSQTWKPACNQPEWRWGAAWACSAPPRVSTRRCSGSKTESQRLRPSSRLGRRMPGVTRVRWRGRSGRAQTRWHWRSSVRVFFFFSSPPQHPGGDSACQALARIRFDSFWKKKENPWHYKVTPVIVCVSRPTGWV